MKKTLIALIISTTLIAGVFANGASESTNPRGNGRGNGTQQGQGRGYGGGANAESNGAIQRENMENLINSYKIGKLDNDEKAGVLLMREEEKLARDVYNALYEKWNIPVFRNIARAEQTHMDAMGILIERYKLTDPVSRDVPGQFDNPELQKLYNSLTAEGFKSLKDALIVGATVEDLDISDLQKLIAKTDNDDIKVVYQNLEKGSRNHMRSFVYQLEREGASYSPQYISKSYYNKIITTDRETGRMIDNPDFKF